MQLMKVVPRTEAPFSQKYGGLWNPESSILGGMTVVGCHMLLVSCAYT